MAEFVRVASVGDIRKGEGRAFFVNNREVAIFNCDGKFYAIDNACKHQGGPLGEGELDGCTVVCPWHGWTYDVRNGQSPDDPDASVAAYPLKVEGDDILIEC